jgi:hypothetical protein
MKKQIPFGRIGSPEDLLGRCSSWFQMKELYHRRNVLIVEDDRTITGRLFFIYKRLCQRKRPEIGECKERVAAATRILFEMGLAIFMACERSKPRRSDPDQTSVASLAAIRPRTSFCGRTDTSRRYAPPLDAEKDFSGSDSPCAIEKRRSGSAPHRSCHDFRHCGQAILPPQPDFCLTGTAFATNPCDLT